MTEIKPPVPDPEREVRVGLVLYGGVSLAIYIYGVALEFWRLVKASRGVEENAYTELLKTTRVSVSVDIVSGASAGGLNGVLLGKALAYGSDMNVVRKLWLEDADMSKLLHRRDVQEPHSLLDGMFFENRLAAGLEEMDRFRTDGALVDVFDLFVAGTRLRGWVREYLDDLGQTLQTRDYRKSFHLRFRTKGFNSSDQTLGYDYNDFTTERNDALLAVARATSAFPGAFEPRLIARDDAAGFLFDAREPAAAYFSDGGILHNKPFSEALDAIVNRMADRPVRRWLMSVEPDPERFAQEAAPGPQPEILEVLLKSSTGIPRYQSIAADLNNLRSHKERVARLNEIVESLDVAVAAQLQQSEGAMPSVIADQQVLSSPYLNTRRVAIERDLVARLIGDVISEDDRPYVENGIQTWMAVDPSRFDQLDSPRETRRIYFLLRRLDRLDLGSGPNVRAVRNRLWAEFERVRSLVWSLFDGSTGSAAAVAALRHKSGSPLASAVSNALDMIAPALSSGLTAIRATVVNVCTEIDELAVGPQVVSMVMAADSFELWDMILLPLEEFAGGGERDQVGFVRISPSAATYVRKRAEDKLAGDALGHFGGFISREWRANDILWGRLDAAEVIVRTLLETRRIEHEPHIRRIQNEIAIAELPQPMAKQSVDYRAYLESTYNVGGQDLADIPADQRISLGLRSVGVLRKVLRRLEKGETPSGQPYPGVLSKGFHIVGKVIGVVLATVRWPAEAIWGRDHAVRRFVTLAILFVAGWGAIMIILMIFNVVPDSVRLWILSALALTLFALFVTGLTLSARVFRRD